jgi:hypothetical protein
MTGVVAAMVVAMVAEMEVVMAVAVLMGVAMLVVQVPLAGVGPLQSARGQTQLMVPLRLRRELRASQATLQAL